MNLLFLIRKAYPFFVLIFWCIILINIFTSTFPIYTNNSFKTKKTVFSVFPQGWGFFTRDPREASTILYSLNKDSISKFTKTNGDLEYLLGVSRENRFVSMEMSYLKSVVNDSLWHYSKGQEFILDKKIKTDTITNVFKPNNIHGDFFIIEQERTPWAWAKSYDKIIMPYKYAKIYVKDN